MITALLDRIAALPADLRAACEYIFHVENAIGYTDPPATMHAWVEQQFGSVDAVRTQQIVKVVNRLTLEGALFNPLRARRPSGASSDDAALDAWIAAELRNDIFRDPQRDTTADIFGRIAGQHCVSASNIAKYDGWHGLVICNEPHPLHFDREQVRDYLDVALRWIAAAHARDPQAIFPMITWNCLPKSGATLVHGHMQLALARGMPYAHVEMWRRATVQYRAATQRNYMDDLDAIHVALGLSVPAPEDVHAFAHLAPMRNREIIIFQDKDTETHKGKPQLNLSVLADALCDTLRALIERQGTRAFNVGIALPPLAATSDDWRDVPIIARLGDRGVALTNRNDWGAMELYGTGCITVDPFDVAAQQRLYDRVDLQIGGDLSQ